MERAYDMPVFCETCACVLMSRKVDCIEECNTCAATRISREAEEDYLAALAHEDDDRTEEER
jgi:hypothetical protein